MCKEGCARVDLPLGNREQNLGCTVADRAQATPHWKLLRGCALACLCGRSRRHSTILAVSGGARYTDLVIELAGDLSQAKTVVGGAEVENYEIFGTVRRFGGSAERR